MNSIQFKNHFLKIANELNLESNNLSYYRYNDKNKNDRKITFRTTYNKNNFMILKELVNRLNNDRKNNNTWNLNYDPNRFYCQLSIWTKTNL